MEWMIVVYGGGGTLVVVLGILFYLRSRASRKSYRCPECGEWFEQAEHLEARNCNVCGSSLNEVKSDRG